MDSAGSLRAPGPFSPYVFALWGMRAHGCTILRAHGCTILLARGVPMLQAFPVRAVRLGLHYDRITIGEGLKSPGFTVTRTRSPGPVSSRSVDVNSAYSRELRTFLFSLFSGISKKNNNNNKNGLYRMCYMHSASASAARTEKNSLSGTS